MLAFFIGLFDYVIMLLCIVLFQGTKAEHMEIVIYRATSVFLCKVKARSSWKDFLLIKTERKKIFPFSLKV